MKRQEFITLIRRVFSKKELRWAKQKKYVVEKQIAKIGNFCHVKVWFGFHISVKFDFVCPGDNKEYYKAVYTAGIQHTELLGEDFFSFNELVGKRRHKHKRKSPRRGG